MLCIAKKEEAAVAANPTGKNARPKEASEYAHIK